MSLLKRSIIVAVVFFASSFGVANAATLFLTPSTQQTNVGGTVNVTVNINSDQPVNAAQGTLYYPANIFNVEQVNTNNSIFNIWVAEPTVNTSTGEISFLGGSTNAFTGSSLPVFNVVFNARGAGKGNAGFNSAEVTAGDGTGANILSTSTVTLFTVGAPSGSTSTQVVSAPTPPPAPTQIKRVAVATTTVPVSPVLSVNLYPDQTAWYSAVDNFLVTWQLPADVTDVATTLDQNPQSNPTISEGLFNNKIFGAVQQGIWYLHVRFKNSIGWGPTANYRIAIDTTPPLPFIATIKEGLVTQVSAPTVQFTTQDQPSGVASYKIFVDGSVVGSTTSTLFVLPSLSFGPHTVIVQAIDYAGNSTESRLSVTIAQPPFLTIAGIEITEEIFFGTIIAVIIIGILIGWWIGRKAKTQRKNRTIIAGRDVSTGFGVVEKNIDKLLDSCNNGSGESQMADIKFLLAATKEEIEKMKHYVSENVEEIEQ